MAKRVSVDRLPPRKLGDMTVAGIRLQRARASAPTQARRLASTSSHASRCGKIKARRGLAMADKHPLA
eukprot:6176074-Pleurochrysis_carterae.AAC.1